MEKLRNVLLRYRQLNNLTQQQLADYLGVTRNNIANWEIGRSTPNNLKTYMVIAEKLNVDIRLLQDDETLLNKDSNLDGTKLALYNQLGELTEEQAQEILNYINYIKSKK